MIEFWQTHGYAWVILPFIIFCARIVDVSIATMRLMFLARGARLPTVVIGFFEALIWIIIVSQVIQNLHNVMCYFAYAGGFAAGSYIGMKLEERLALGKVVMRVITQQPAAELLERLRENKFGVTSVPAEGAKGPVRILFMVIDRSRIAEAGAIINASQPGAFYTIEDVRHASEGFFPVSSDPRSTGQPVLYRWISRKR